MNEKHIEDLITSLYDMIQDARAVPLAADKCFVERIRRWICWTRSLPSCLLS